MEAAEMAKRKVSLMKEIKEEVVQQVRMLMFSITFPLILIADFSYQIRAILYIC